MKLNYGIIGSGMMGCEHIRNLRRIPNVNVVAIADPNEKSRETEGNLGNTKGNLRKT